MTVKTEVRIRITEPFQLENTFKIIEPNWKSSAAKSITKLYSKVPPPGLLISPPFWTACSNAL